MDRDDMTSALNARAMDRVKRVDYALTEEEKNPEPFIPNEPKTEQQLWHDPEFQEHAVTQYEYAKKSMFNKLVNPVPNLSDKQEIAKWATDNYGWMSTNLTKAAIDYVKMRNMPADVFLSVHKGREMYNATPTDARQATRGTVAAAADPLNWLGVSTLAKFASMGVSKVGAERMFTETARKIMENKAGKYAAVGTAASIEGGAWGAGDAALRENLASEAEGREFDTGTVKEQAAIGAIAAPLILGGGAAGLKAGQKAAGYGAQKFRLMRGSVDKALANFTESGKPAYWTDSQSAATNYIGTDGAVHVADAEPRNPLILSQESYQPQELIERLDLDPTVGAEIIEEVGSEAVSVKDLIDSPAVEAALKESGVDMVIMKEATDAPAVQGLEAGSQADGAIVSYKVLDNSIMKKPKGFTQPIFVPKGQRGMVGTYYHGSGVWHDGFKEEFLRTGEGAAVYGEGFYVAQRKGVGKWYQEKLGNRNVTIDGEQVKGKKLPQERLYVYKTVEGEIDAPEAAKRLIANEITKSTLTQDKGDDFVMFATYNLERSRNQKVKHNQKLMDQMNKLHEQGKTTEVEKLRPVLDRTRREIRAMNDIVEEMDKFDPARIEINQTGHLYRTRVIPDEKHFLDWDKPLKEQSTTVKKALRKLGVKSELRAPKAAAKKLVTRLEKLELDEGLQAAVDRWKSVSRKQDVKELWQAADALFNGIKVYKATLWGEDITKPKPDLFYEMENLADDIRKVRMELGDNDIDYETGSTIYNKLKNQYGRDEIRDVLHEAGIKGNIYLDGSSRHQGEGSHNLVVFKEQDIEIRQRDKDMFRGYDVAAAKQYLKDVGIADPDKEFGYREAQDYVDAARERGYDGEPIDAPWFLDRARVSTRFPTGKNRPEDPHKKELYAGLKGMRQVPDQFENNMHLISQYPNFKSKATTAEGRANAAKKHLVDNLVWLHNQVPKEIRERSKKWYDGANTMANTWASKYDMPSHSIAGVMAVLSPQKDWYMNVSLAERVLDIMTHHQDTKWSTEMMEKGREIISKDLDMTKPADQAKYNRKANELALISGKALGELTEAPDKALWLRIYDEAFHDRGHKVVTPEGNFAEEVVTDAGEKAMTGWGSIGEIAKAVRIFDNPTLHNVSNTLGEMHKVRNFYNNIIDPSNNMDVTVDTHAVAAGWLRPLSGDSVEVVHNFGSNKKGQRGASNSSLSGSKGTYGIYADAYREAAAQLGLLPRELQSITWEAIRGMYTAGFKNSDANVEMVDKIWYSYRQGKITLDEARNQAHEYSKGINPPTWYGRSDSGHVDAQRGSSYSGEIHGSGVSRPYNERSRLRGTSNDSGVSPSGQVIPSAILGATAMGGAGAIQFLPYSGEQS